MSSSRLVTPGQGEAVTEFLVDTPRDVRFERAEVEGGTRVVVGHDGYVSTHGLTHVRTFQIDFEGRELRGEDVLLARTQADRQKFESSFDKSKLQGVDFSICFHLHPGVDATLDMNGTAVSMVLKSSEIWVFRFDGPASLDLEASVFLEKSRLSPRATKQIVLSGTALEYSTRVSWSLAKTKDTPTAVRDFADANGELVHSD